MPASPAARSPHGSRRSGFARWALCVAYLGDAYLLKSGRYQNASEVMREGLRALEDRIKREEADLTRFQRRVRTSLEQLDRGESTQDSVKQIFDQAFADAKDRREP